MSEANTLTLNSSLSTLNLIKLVYLRALSCFLDLIAQSCYLVAELVCQCEILVLTCSLALFDQFKNFMERGRVFKEMVRALPE